MNKNLSIAVIDSGVDKKHKSLLNKDILNYSFSDFMWTVDECLEIFNGHGTAVTSIIINNLDENVKIHSFQIFKEELECNVDVLINCLKFIDENLDCKVINLSLGIKTFNSDLYDICLKLYKKNVYIVSAFSNDGGVSYPACFDFVIGVDSSSRLIKQEDFGFIENCVVNIMAKGMNHRVAWLKNTFTITQGASFSCAYVTRYIIKAFLNCELSFNELMNLLKEKSIYKTEFNNLPIIKKNYNFNDIKDIAIFPYNKELTSLLNFPNLLKFKLIDIYEHKRFGKVGLKVRSEYNDISYILKDINKCEWSKFDTLVIGHLTEMEKRIGVDIKAELLQRCLKEHKNVICFDERLWNEYINVFTKENLLLYCPSVRIAYNTNFDRLLEKLYDFKTPIVGVFGTSKQQGKFTLQLAIKNKLLELGYRVSQLGTEPQSILFGFDFTIPFGYESNNNLVSNDMISLCNYLVSELDKNDSDIIIVGSQANTLPISLSNLRYLDHHQTDFLVGCKPDCIVLNVNYHDNINYIERTIKCIEMMADCKVVALCIFPVGYENEWDLLMDKKRKIDYIKLLEFSVTLKNKFNINAYVLGDKDFDTNIVEQIVDFFSGEE